MVKLLGCIECGTPLDSNTAECPHCHTQYPRGVVCLSCFQTLKQSGAVKYENPATHSVKYFHASCYQKITHPHSQLAGATSHTLDPLLDPNPSLVSEETLKAEATRMRQEEARKRAEHRARTISRTLRFFFLATLGFIFWGLILSLMFGPLGLLIAFIVTILLTVEIMKEMA